MKILTKVTCGMAVFGLFGIANIAKATEGGGSTYPGGAENYLVGAAPPPGFMFWSTVKCTQPTVSKTTVAIDSNSRVQTQCGWRSNASDLVHAESSFRWQSFNPHYPSISECQCQRVTDIGRTG